MVKMADDGSKHAQSGVSKSRTKPVIYTATDGQIIVEWIF